MSNAVMGAMLGSASLDHSIPIQLQMTNAAQEEALFCSDLPQWILQMAASFRWREGSLTVRMWYCSLNSTAHSCGRRPPTHFLLSGCAVLCCAGNGTGDRAHTAVPLEWVVLL